MQTFAMYTLRQRLFYESGFNLNGSGYFSGNPEYKSLPWRRLLNMKANHRLIPTYPHEMPPAVLAKFAPFLYVHTCLEVAPPLKLTPGPAQVNLAGATFTGGIGTCLFTALFNTLVL